MREQFSFGKRDDVENSKKKGLNRRDFLRGLATVGAGAVASESVLRAHDFISWSEDWDRTKRFEKWDGLSASERQQRIDAEVARAGDFLKSKEGRRILDSGTDDEVFGLLMTMPALLREHLKGTSHEVKGEAWPSVAVAFSQEHKVPYAIDLHSDRATLERHYRGNGVFVAPDTILTNWHIFGADPFSRHVSKSDNKLDYLPTTLRKKYETTGLDALYIKFDNPPSFDSPEHKPNVLPLADISDEELIGKLVKISSIDPDEASAADGTKVAPSVAVPVTKRVAEFLEKYAKYSGHDTLAAQNSFIAIAPPGEAYWRPFPSVTGSRAIDAIKGYGIDKTSRGQGTSGSPVVLDGKLVGLNHRGANVEYKGVGLDLKVFHGPNALRSALANGSMCNEKDVGSIVEQKYGYAPDSYYSDYVQYEDYSFDPGSTEDFTEK